MILRVCLKSSSAFRLEHGLCNALVVQMKMPPFFHLFILYCLCHTFPAMEVLILLYFLVPFGNLMYCKVFYMCPDYHDMDIEAILAFEIKN